VYFQARERSLTSGSTKEPGWRRPRAVSVAWIERGKKARRYIAKCGADAQVMEWQNTTWSTR